MIRIRSDIERKRLYPDRKNRYLPEATEQTYKHLHELAKNSLDYGYPVILDATYLEKRLRDAAKATAELSQHDFFILSLTHDKSVLEKRIKKRLNSSNNPSEATIEVMHQQLKTLDALDNEEIIDTVYVDNNETVVETFNNHLLKRQENDL